MIKSFLSLILLLPAASRAEEGLTLSYAVELALASDEALKAESANADAAKAAAKAAGLARLGGLKLKGMYTDGDDPVYAFATAMKQGTFSMASMATINDPASASNYLAAIEAGVPLYAGGALNRGARMGKLGAEAASLGYGRARAGIAFKAVHQWLAALLRQRLAAIADETVKAADEEMKTARMLMEKGMVPGADYYGAEAILATLRGYQVNWRGALEIERARLGETVGQTGPAGAAGELAAPAYAAPSAGQRLDVLAMEKAAEIGAEAEKMQAASVLPLVEAFGSWEANSATLSDFRNNRILGLRVTLPLGDPAYFAKRSAAKAQAAGARSRAAGGRRLAALELEEARANYAASRESLPAAREAMEKARRSLELFRPLYRQGRQSVLEVLRAQAALMQAEAGYAETLFKLNLFHAQQLFAAERLDAAAVAGMSAALAVK